MFKCAHISDVHWRGLSRHEEYKETFEDFYKKISELCPDVIFVGGDIVHSKTQGISPELIDCLCEWFKKMSDVAPVHVILGNHDGLILNKHRQDAITPIVKAIDPNQERIKLFKKSGTYPTGIEGFNWCVFSCFDEEGWDNVKPVEGEINIAAFHGGVNGSSTDIDWNIEGDVDTSFFEDYDFTFLGDIHKLQYLDDQKRIAYPGSTIQQNYGEDPGKGFLFWEIESKDKFVSTFYSLYHSKPFVTIPWMGNVPDTVEESMPHPQGSRFRIKSDAAIPQSEIKHLHSSLKEIKNATEIVFKNDLSYDKSVIKTNNTQLFKDDLRDYKVHQRLMREYYSGSNLSEKDLELLDEIVQKYVSLAARDDNPRNIKWTIKNLKFDNMFAYGKDNVVNFDNLSGITGIFGKNRTGKSSIPGTVMYSLYNTTDRGSISNLHVINSRKGYCFAAVDLSANGKNYRVERQSVKHESRKGVVSATTHLNLSEIDSVGEVVKDLNGEQRRETEKTLRQIVGTADDFLLTSMASQGAMNTFIKYKATQRKAILTRFLDLNVFDDMLSHARDDSSEIKALLKNAPDREWDIVIDEKEKACQKSTELRSVIDGKLADLRNKRSELQIILATHKDRDLVTKSDVIQHEKIVNDLHKSLNTCKDDLQKNQKEIEDLDKKISSIENIKSNFPIEDLKERFEAQKDLESALKDLEHKRALEKQVLDSKKKLAKKIEPCDCFEHLPSCKYLKESTKHNKAIKEQKSITDELLDSIRAARKSLRVLEKEGLSDKIEKYSDVLNKESDLRIKQSNCKVKINSLMTSNDLMTKELSEKEKELSDMRLRVSDGQQSDEVSKFKKMLHEMDEQIKDFDAKKMSLTEKVGKLSGEVSRLKSEKAKYAKLIQKWKIYDLFMGAVSKRGIPLQIMSSQLPIINKEISNILQGVVGFTVELVADSKSNDMDVFINYGDSKRIIECGSGMEKMISSLAIRVALINVSSLPKTDLLVIDEGFGALDDMNIEACSRLLESLKKWFKNILIISHVDAIKDSVDNVLEITQVEKNSKVVYE